MSQPAASPTQPLGLVARAMGIVFSPGRTFQDVVRSPRPVGILFWVCLAVAAASAIPQMTAGGRRAALDMQIAQAERMTGQPIAPEQRTQMERFASYGAGLAFGATFLALPAFCVFLTGLFWALFNVVLGGTAEFKQVLGIVTHSQVIGALGLIASVPILVTQETWSPMGPFNLSALVPMLEPDSPIVAALSGLSFFGGWQAVVLGIGLAVLYRKKATGPVLVVLALYLATGVGWAMLASMFRS